MNADERQMLERIDTRVAAIWFSVFGALVGVLVVVIYKEVIRWMMP